MAFSFNWAGVTAPQVPAYKDPVAPEDFAALGKALRGYQNREAAKDYAKLIEKFRTDREASGTANANRIAEIKSEISRLKQENAMLEGSINGEAQKAADRYSGMVPLSEAFKPDELEAMVFDPATASPEDIKKMQQYVGVKADGDWGQQSQAAFDLKYGPILKQISY